MLLKLCVLLQESVADLHSGTFELNFFQISKLYKEFRLHYPLHPRVSIVVKCRRNLNTSDYFYLVFFSLLALILQIEIWQIFCFFQTSTTPEFRWIEE